MSNFNQQPPETIGEYLEKQFESSVIPKIARKIVQLPDFVELIKPVIEQVIHSKPTFYTREEAAVILRVCMKTLDTRIKDGRLPSKKLGNRVLIPEEALFKVPEVVGEK